MTGNIFMEDGDHLIELKEEPYELEAVLQDLLSKNPSLISSSLDNTNSNNKLILVKAEAKLKADSDTSLNWWIDHLFLDTSGIPTIVEVKRSTDTRIRREVIGQVLEYAANAVTQFSAESIRLLVEVNADSESEGSLSRIEEFLGSGVDVDEYWQSVQTNLQAGRLRLLLVADKIPRETKRVIEFLNEQMSPTEILAIEVRQMSAGGKKIFLPTVFGQSILSQDKKSSSGPKKQWDETSFLGEIDSKSQRASIVAKKLIHECQARHVRDWWGAGAQSGSYFPMIDSQDNWYAMFAVWSSGNGYIEIQFQRLSSIDPFKDEKLRQELLEKLNLIDGVSISHEKLTKRPSIPLQVLENDESMRKFLEIFDWFIQKVSNA